MRFAKLLFVAVLASAVPAVAQTSVVDRLFLPMFPIGERDGLTYTLTLRILRDPSTPLPSERSGIGDDGLVSFRDRFGRPLMLEIATTNAITAPAAFLDSSAAVEVTSGPFELVSKDKRTVEFGSVEVATKVAGVRAIAIIETRDQSGNLTDSIEVPLLKTELARGVLVDAELDSRRRTWVAILNPGLAAASVTFRAYVLDSGPSILTRRDGVKEVTVNIAPKAVFMSFLDEDPLFPALKGTRVKAVEVSSNSAVIVNAYRVGAQTTLIPVFPK